MPHGDHDQPGAFDELNEKAVPVSGDKVLIQDASGNMHWGELGNLPGGGSGPDFIIEPDPLQTSDVDAHTIHSIDVAEGDAVHVKMFLASLDVDASDFIVGAFGAGFTRIESGDVTMRGGPSTHPLTWRNDTNKKGLFVANTETQKIDCQVQDTEGHTMTWRAIIFITKVNFSEAP